MFNKIFTFLLLLILLTSSLYLSTKGFMKNKYINHSITLLLVLLIISSIHILDTANSIENFTIDPSLKLPNNDNNDNNEQIKASNTGLGGTTEHLELAYKLCQSHPDRTCQKYVTQYE